MKNPIYSVYYPYKGDMMDIGDIRIVLVIIATIGAGVTFLVNKIMNSAKHEQSQNNKIDTLFKGREDCVLRHDKLHKEIIGRIEVLEQKDRATELTLVSIKERMESLIQGHETTQAMVQRLEDHHQTMFKQLIDTIKESVK